MTWLNSLKLFFIFILTLFSEINASEDLSFEFYCAPTSGKDAGYARKFSYVFPKRFEPSNWQRLFSRYSNDNYDISLFMTPISEKAYLIDPKKDRFNEKVSSALKSSYYGIKRDICIAYYTGGGGNEFAAKSYAGCFREIFTKNLNIVENTSSFRAIIIGTSDSGWIDQILFKVGDPSFAKHLETILATRNRRYTITDRTPMKMSLYLYRPRRSFVEIIYNDDDANDVSPSNYSSNFIKTKDGKRDILVVVFPHHKKNLFVDRNNFKFKTIERDLEKTLDARYSTPAEDPQNVCLAFLQTNSDGDNDHINLSNECFHQIFTKGMGIREGSSQLRVIIPDVRTRTNLYGGITSEGFKDGDHRVATALRKFAIPSMTLFISHGDEVFNYDVYPELDHVGPIESDEAFLENAKKNKYLNMVIFVLSFEYLDTVTKDGLFTDPVDKLLEQFTDKSSDVAFAFVHNDDANFKSRINEYLNQIFIDKFQMVLSTPNFRTLGLGVMVDRYNEYIGGIYPRKMDEYVAKQIERKILRIYPSGRERSMMRMMVFVPHLQTVQIDVVIYDQILGQLIKRKDKRCFKVKEDERGNISNILAIVFPLKYLDIIMNEMEEKLQDIIDATEALAAKPSVVAFTFYNTDNMEKYVEEAKYCLDEFYYKYLNIRKNDDTADLRIIGVGHMDQNFVGGLPLPHEYAVVDKIEKEILKLRLTSMTIYRFLFDSKHTEIEDCIYDEEKDEFNHPLKRYSIDPTRGQHNIMLLLFPLSKKKDMWDLSSSLFRYTVKKVSLVYRDSKASANVILYDDHGKTDVEKAKLCAKKIFFQHVGLKPTDILRFVDIETLQMDCFGENEPYTRDEYTLVKKLQSYIQDSYRESVTSQ